MGLIGKTLFVPKQLFKKEGHERGSACTIASGYTLKQGAVVGQFTSGPNSGLFGPHDPTATDGREVAVGVLYASINTTSTDDANGKATNAATPTTMWVRGDFDYAVLNAQYTFDGGTPGCLTTKAIADMNARFIIANDWLYIP